VTPLEKEKFTENVLSTNILDSFLHSHISKDDITVVIPVLNEEEGIEKVIKRVKKEGYINILVVDGYSTDNTVSLAIKNGVNVIFQHGKGKTGAIKTAIEQLNTQFFVVMDGDCTYNPKDIENFLIHARSYDEIIGVRTTGRHNIPFLNRFGNWLINFIFNLLFGTTLNDVCSGMYLLNTGFAKELTFTTNGFDVEVEIAAQVASMGKIIQGRDVFENYAIAAACLGLFDVGNQRSYLNDLKVWHSKVSLQI